MYIGDNIYRALQDWRGLPGTGNARSQSWSPVQHMNESRRMYESHPVCVPTMYHSVCTNYVSPCVYQLCITQCVYQLCITVCVYPVCVSTMYHLCINYVSTACHELHAMWHIVDVIQSSWLKHIVRDELHARSRSSSPVQYMNESCVWMGQAWMSLSHVCINHVTHVNKSCHTFARVVSHIHTNHVTHTNESSLPIAITRTSEVIRACATVRFNMCHQAFVNTRTNESHHTCEWVIVADRYHPYEWNDSSCHTYECDSTL